jgi:hypothetical protein
MTVKNTRQKGRAFVRKCLNQLYCVDTSAYEVVGSGAGHDKGDIRLPKYDLVIECKDNKQATVANWTGQTEKQGLGYSRTALMWRHPKSPSAKPDIRVDISLDFFRELLARFSEPAIKAPDREMKYLLQRLTETAKKIIKNLE